MSHDPAALTDLLAGLSEDDRMYLRMYSPETYGMNLPRDVSKSLQDAGIVEWLPPTGWSGTIYGLTEVGREARALLATAPAQPETGGR